MKEAYIELHARSAFSFLEGASLPEELASRCAELNMPGMALLDRDGVSGSARFHLAAKKLGLRAHIGAEVTSAGGCRYPVLAENRTGYQNLCRLITRMKMRSKKGWCMPTVIAKPRSATSEDFGSSVSMQVQDYTICLIRS